MPVRFVSAEPLWAFAPPFGGVTHASPLQRPVDLEYPRTGAISPAGPSAWVALSTRSRRRRLRKGRWSSATPGQQEGRPLSKGRLGSLDPGAGLNAACPALAARRVVNGRQGIFPPMPAPSRICRARFRGRAYRPERVGGAGNSHGGPAPRPLDPGVANRASRGYTECKF